jgi:3-hydroxyacyl-[acyl-carrier-protein] dehydratase
MSKQVDINQIMTLLPHRFPFLLIDRVLDYKPRESLVAIKNVTMNEPHFTGHFPQRPVMPGVLMIEAMAQAGAILYFQTHLDEGTPDDGLIFLAGIDNARFKRIVVPGDQLRFEVKVTKIKARIWKLEGTAHVGDELACSAEIMSAR